MTAEETLRAAWRALGELERHAEQRAGIPALDGARACAPCMKFAAAVMRGAKPAAALHLRCPETQEWQRQIEAANRLVFGATA